MQKKPDIEFEGDTEALHLLGSVDPAQEASATLYANTGDGTDWRTRATAPAAKKTEITGP